MSITNYIRPQSEVYQMLEVTNEVTNDHLYACVVGPQYQLSRYGKEDVQNTGFSSFGTTVYYEFEQDPAFDYEVDTKSVRLFAEALEATLATFETKVKVDPVEPHVLRMVDPITDGYFKAEWGSMVPDFKQRPVNIGDVVYVESENAGGDTVKVRATVTDLAPLIIHPAPVLNGTLVMGALPAGVLPTTAKYIGKVNTTYVLKCIAIPSVGTYTIKVTDTAGSDLGSLTTMTSAGVVALSIGTKGVKFLPTGITWALNETLTIDCVAPYASDSYDGIVLDKIPYDITAVSKGETLPKVTLHYSFTGELPRSGEPDAFWTAHEMNITVAPNGAIYVPGRTSNQYVPLDNNKGRLYLEYRTLVIPQEEEELIEIEVVEDIQKNFGTIAPENTLAYGCHRALVGSAGRKLYALRVRSDDEAGFTAAVQKTEHTTKTYTFAPLTKDMDALRSVVAFNDELSQPDVKRWRRTVIGVDTPGEYDVSDLATTDARLARANIVADAEGKYRVVQLTEDSPIGFLTIGVNNTVLRLNSGDKIKLNATATTYTIARVLSDRELLLTTGATTAASNVLISFVKADTAANASEYIITAATQFNQRRALVCWTDRGINAAVDAYAPVDNMFLAAEIAGISSAVLPQRSITRTEVTGVTHAPRMYTKYTQVELNRIAREGVLIVTQDSKNASCYIRHQLTTETDKGNLYYEDSCTRNLDNISFALTDIIDGYIGRANVTPTALRRLRNDLTTRLNAFTADSTDDLVGPSLVEWHDLVIVQDPKFKDRVIITVKLALPLPLNNIRLYEMAYAATVTI